MTVIDADGHVTESAEQLVKYMDAPFRDRQLVFPIVPADGWDRRLIRKYHDTAGTADARTPAPDKRGGRHAGGLTAPVHLKVHPHDPARDLGGAGVDLFPRFIQAHTCSHPFGQMRQLTSIVFEGIPERFPDLRIAFLEAGAGWAPYWMERMDDEYDKRGEVEAPLLKKKPSDYVRSGNIYFSCEADEWLLPQALEHLGENQIVYASDFPHLDLSFPGSIDEIRDRRDLTDTQKRKVLADNCRRLYKLQ